MRALRDPAEVALLPDAPVRRYLAERFEGMAEDGVPYDPETFGWFLLVEPGDDPDGAAAFFDCYPLLQSVAGVPYGQDGFAPVFDWVTDRGVFYEAIVILSDGGDFVGVVVPKSPGIDQRLIELCAGLATTEPPQF